MDRIVGSRRAHSSLALVTLVSVALGVLLGVLPGPAAAADLGGTGPASAMPARLAAVEPPDVVGLPLAEAREVLAQEWYPDRQGGYELVVRVQPDQPRQVSPDGVLVVAQDVTQYLEDSDDARLRAVIVLTVGAAVPDLLGRSGGEAEELLDLLGLDIRVDGEGLVVRQSAPSGSLVPFGTVVVVRLEPSEPGTRVVPDLAGLTAAGARAALEQVDLALAVADESGDGERTVRTQDPVVGTEVRPGSMVRVTLVGDGAPTSTVEVPDVTGLGPDAAARVVAAAGLVLTADPADAGADALAFRQDPLAGEQVDPGTEVRVTFAVGLRDRPASWLPWLGGSAAVVLVAALVGLAALRPRGRGPRSGTPTAERLTVEPRVDTAPRISTRATSAGPDVVLQVLATPDAGTLVLEEEEPR